MIKLPDNVCWDNTDKNTKATEALTEMYHRENYVVFNDKPQYFEVSHINNPDSWDKQDVSEFHIANNEDTKDFTNGK